MPGWLASRLGLWVSTLHGMAGKPESQVLTQSFERCHSATEVIACSAGFRSDTPKQHKWSEKADAWRDKPGRCHTMHICAHAIVTAGAENKPAAPTSSKASAQTQCIT